VGDRRIADTAGRGVPERGAIARAHRHCAAGRVAGEDQPGLGGQDAGAALAADRMVPADLAGLVVDRPHEPLAADAVVGARPAVGAVLGLEEVDAVAVLGADDEQPGLRIEAGGAVIGAASLVWGDEASVARRLLIRVGDGAALLVDALRPVDGRERLGEKALAG